MSRLNCEVIEMKYDLVFDVRVNGKIMISASSEEEAKEIVGSYDVQTIIKRVKHPKTTIYAFSIKKADDEEPKKQSRRGD